jgi:ComF family protein
LYPPVCGICSKGKNTYLCKKCEKKLLANLILGKDEYENCFFEKHFYMFKYDSLIRKLLLDYKFNEKPYLYQTFIQIFENYYKKGYLQFDFYDIIVPVPISKKRLKLRGYNQSELFDKKMAKILNVKLDNNVLKKAKHNIAQSLLDKNAREKNVQNMYKVVSENVRNKNILLIDDIFTTGATVNECSKILKQAGACKIDIFTIAKD